MCDISFGIYLIFINFLKTETLFLVFLFKRMGGEWSGYSVAGEFGMDFKSNESDFITVFFLLVLKVEKYFME